MVAWQELHIQSNLPLIVLAVSFICIVIIGFLEFKKVSIRIDELSEQIKSLRMNNQNMVINDKNTYDDNNIDNDDNDESTVGGEIIIEEEKLNKESDKIKEVDRSLSIKELRKICQEIGITSSGNKEQLIQRINSEKKK